MTTILVPTDFSDIANNATLFAFKLANKSKARVILLHTYTIPFIDLQAMNLSASFLYDTIDLNQFEHFKKNNEKLRKLAEEKNIQIGELSHKLVMGEIPSAINDSIEEDGVDFVVVGTSGGNDWFSNFFGSNTDSIIVSTQVPTLILPKDYLEEEMINIGFTTRFRDKDKPALRKTIEFAKKMGLRVKCMYAQLEPSKSEEILIKAWQEEFKADPVEFFVYPCVEVMDTIEYFITQDEIDLLVMVTYKRNLFMELFTRRFTQKVSQRVSIPLLVLHER